jgi:hypothetical protein
VREKTQPIETALRGQVFPITTGAVDPEIIQSRSASQRSSKELVAELQRIDQRVDLCLCVVQTEGRTAGRRYAHMRHQRLRAMVPGADRDALLVQHGRDVMGVGRTLHRERKYRGLAGRLTLDGQPVQAIETRARIVPQARLVCRDVVHAKRHHVVQRRTQPDHLGDTWRAGFEFHRRIVVGDCITGHIADHVAAPHEWPHLGKPFRCDPDRARRRRAIKLVASDRVEIAPYVGDVDRHVDCGLAAIDEYRDAAGMCGLRDRLYVHDCAENV